MSLGVDMKRLILIIFTLLLIISSIGFSKTKGFITDVSTENFQDYCIEYEDSMANDNIVIEIGKLIFFVILFMQVFFIRKNISFVENAFYLIICLFQTILIFVAQSDGCSILKTIIYTNNYFLLIYVCIFFLFLIYNIVLLIKRIIKNRKI